MSRPGLVLMAALCWASTCIIKAQDTRRVDFWPAVLLENAWSVKPGAFWIHCGIEFEEDSGDFPTTKTILHLRQGLAEDFMLTATALLVRFNSNHYTAWGGSNTALGFQYTLCGTAESTSAVQIKGEAFVPSGGMGTGRWNLASGIDASWLLERTALHVNGHYTWGSVNDKRLDERVGVSELDRWRLAAGVSRWLVPNRWNFIAAVVGAKPIRPKDSELSLEVGIRSLLSAHWGWSAGAGVGLREKGQEYIARFGLDYRR